MKVKQKPCPSCNGSGSVPGDEAGSVLRAAREKLGLAQRDVATAMHISTTYLFDLETDRRRWTTELVAEYEKALGVLQGKNKIKEP